ncbi:MAG: hypothetical protein ACNI3C_00440 [Candidatus Marinarcus sp.]|uniref:hypothetical protein n=1 Tax=Candidatus Marinarcus sp. TaxID=3100987 RepID=UPI003B002A1C
MAAIKYKREKINKISVKYLLTNIENQTSLAIYVFNEGIDTYNFITSMMSKRVKIKFDINYEVIKHKELSKNSIDEAYNEIENILSSCTFGEDEVL